MIFKQLTFNKLTMNNELRSNKAQTPLTLHHAPYAMRYALCAAFLIILLVLLYSLGIRLAGGLYQLKAQNALTEKSYTSAIEYLKKADLLKSDDYQIKRRLGQVTLELMKLEERPENAWPRTLKAQEYFIAASRQNPLDAESVYGMAMVESRLEQLYPFIISRAGNNPYQPLSWFKEAVRLRPSSITFRYAMAYYLYSTGKKDELLPLLQTLAGVYPQAYFNLKKEAFWSPSVREAVKQGLEQAIEQDISLRNAHRAMSYIAAEDKDWEAAIRHYNQVLQYRTFENSTYDYFRLGSLYLKSEEQEKVEANFIKGLDRSRSRDKDLEWIYGQYRKENKLEGFTQFFLQVSNHFISTAAMEILHARAFIDLKEYDQAKEVLLTVNKRSPEAVAYYWLSHIAELEKEWDIMDLAIQKATVLDPENSEYHYKFSRVLNRLKKYERAEKEASLAIKYRSKNPTSGFFNYRAGIRWTMKDYEGAAKDWKSAISLKPDHAAFYAQAGEAYAKLAYWPMAEEHYQKAMELAPNNKRYRDRYNAVKGSGSSEQ